MNENIDICAYTCIHKKWMHVYYTIHKSSSVNNGVANDRLIARPSVSPRCWYQTLQGPTGMLTGPRPGWLTKTTQYSYGLWTRQLEQSRFSIILNRKFPIVDNRKNKRRTATSHIAFRIVTERTWSFGVSSLQRKLPTLYQILQNGHGQCL